MLTHSLFRHYIKSDCYQDQDIALDTLAFDQTSYLDNGLSPSSEYCYDIYGVNVQGIRSPVQQNCAFTGSPPYVVMENPAGGEILKSDSEYMVYFDLFNSNFVKLYFTFNFK